MSENQTPAPIEVSAKKRAEDFYGLNVKLTNLCKVRFRGAPIEALEETLGAYLGLVQQQAPEVKEGEDPPTIEVSTQIMQQMALLAGVTLSRLIQEKYKGIRE